MGGIRLERIVFLALWQGRRFPYIRREGFQFLPVPPLISLVVQPLRRSQSSKCCGLKRDLFLVLRRSRRISSCCCSFRQCRAMLRMQRGCLPRRAGRVPHSVGFLSQQLERSVLLRHGRNRRPSCIMFGAVLFPQFPIDGTDRLRRDPCRFRGILSRPKLTQPFAQLPHAESAIHRKGFHGNVTEINEF